MNNFRMKSSNRSSIKEFDGDRFHLNQMSKQGIGMEHMVCGASVQNTSIIVGKKIYGSNL